MSSRDIIAVCQRLLPLVPNDCSGFVRAVARQCGVLVFGNANEMVDYLAGSGRVLPDGPAAARRAAAGDLVIGGAKAAGHGHVVVVVDGPLSHGRYPYAFWGQYHGLSVAGTTYNVGFTRGHGTVNWAFGPSRRDSLVYAAFPPASLLLPKAGETEGHLIYTFT